MKTYKDYNYIPLSGTGGTGSEGYDKLLDGDKETRHTGGQTLCVPDLRRTAPGGASPSLPQPSTHPGSATPEASAALDPPWVGHP